MSFFPVEGPVISCDRTPAEDLVLLGCQDGTIVMFDENKHIKRTIHASVVCKVYLFSEYLFKTKKKMLKV